MWRHVFLYYGPKTLGHSHQRLGRSTHKGRNKYGTTRQRVNSVGVMCPRTRRYCLPKLGIYYNGVIIKFTLAVFFFYFKSALIFFVLIIRSVSLAVG